MPRTRTVNKKKGTPRRFPFSWQNQYGNKPYYSKSRYPSKRRDEEIYNKTLTIVSTQTTTAVSGDVALSLNFTLAGASSLPNYAALTTLFAQYRINKIEFTATPTFNVISNTAVGAETGLVSSCIQYTSTISPSILDITDSNTCIQTGFSKPHKRIIYPKILMSTNSANSFVAEDPKWFSTQSSGPSAAHYGLQINFPAPASTATNVWTTTAKLYLSFKNNN